MIYSLTGLRCYAALLVFVSHLYLFDYFMNLQTGLLSSTLREIGWVGVSLFFTLSGFVLYVNYLNPAKQARFNPLSFYQARFARVYPAFLIATLVAAPLEWFSQSPPIFWKSLLFHLGLIHCFDEQACTAFTQVGWSLSHEAVFYALFPLLGLLFYFKKPVVSVLITIFVHSILVFSLFGLFGHEFYAQGSFALNRIGEFLLGMLAGHLYLKYRHPAKRLALLPFITPLVWGVMSVSVLMMSLRTGLMSMVPQWEPLGFLLYPVPAFLIILGLALLESIDRPSPLLVHPWVLFGGQISYSFYLIHHLIMRYSLHAARIGFNLDLKTIQGLLGFLIVFGLLAISIIGAYWLHEWVEKPCSKWLKWNLAPKRL
jgi:peptidoglycan/LPS O-acetylase OafA/YrhL